MGTIWLYILCFKPWYSYPSKKTHKVVISAEPLHKKLSFSLTISSLNVKKFHADFVIFTEEFLNEKLFFLWGAGGNCMCFKDPNQN